MPITTVAHDRMYPAALIDTKLPTVVTSPSPQLRKSKCGDIKIQSGDFNLAPGHGYATPKHSDRALKLIDIQPIHK